MKKIFLAVAAIAFTLIGWAKTPSEVSQKVLDAFHNTFQNAKDVSWHEYTDCYEVRFKQGEIDTRIKYDVQGNLLESTRYYFEDNLPLFIKAKLKGAYKDKKVFGVTEVAKDAELTYYIILEDDTNWTTIKSDYFGNISVQKKYKKV